MLLRQLSFIPLAFALLFFPSAQYHLQLKNDAEMILFGFPLPWNADSPATSMGKDIYLLPLALDFALLCWLSICLIKILNLNKTNFRVTIIWAWGLLCTFATTQYFASIMPIFAPLFDRYLLDLPIDQIEMMSIRLGLGF